MAIYHFSMNPIGRAQGRSATAAAAYRAAVKIADERTGLIYDFTRKRGVIHAELLLPGGATEDRAAFWNRVEVHHKRGDAVLAREVEVSLPGELPAPLRQVLAMDYARELGERYGVAVDVAMHAPRTITKREFERNPDQYFEIDEVTGRRHNGNWHAHIMLSACYVGLDGTLGKKAVELDPIHCQRAKIANISVQERERWSELTNAALKAIGSSVQVSHLSLADQGIDREPQVHLGPHASAVERKTGEASRRRLWGQRRAKANKKTGKRPALEDAVSINRASSGARKSSRGVSHPPTKPSPRRNER